MYDLQVTLAIILFLQNCSSFQLSGVDHKYRNQREILPVEFSIFTRNSGNEPSYIKIGNFRTLNTSGFDEKLETKIIIHGFKSSVEEKVFVTIKDAYLGTGDFNIIGMDWSPLSNLGYIATISSGVKTAGSYLGDFLIFLRRFSGLDFNKLHLIGHSLGAHVAYIATKKLGDTKIGRITALDPAGPGFRDIHPDIKLDKIGAQMVDGIHTHLNVLGLAGPIGHIDFYPNGGRFQPGCPPLYDLENFLDSIICNHSRSYLLFAESIRNKNAFLSLKCLHFENVVNGTCDENNGVYMGQIETYKNGIYYLRTNAESPYSMTP